MNPYKILGLETSATKQEIKKAYFRLIRIHTPEKDPEAFKEIRAAYEYLQDDTNRSNMNHLSSIPNEFQKPYEQVLTFIKSKDYEKAINLCEYVLSIASIEPFEALLGTCYIKNNNSGKAIKVWDDLYLKYPNNWDYLEYLGDAYLARGWTKKAFQTYQKLLPVKPESIMLYGNLLTAIGEEPKDIPLKLSLTQDLFSCLEHKSSLSREEHQELCEIFMFFIPYDLDKKTSCFILDISDRIFDVSSKYCLEISDYFEVLIAFLTLHIHIFESYSLGENQIKKYQDFLHLQFIHLLTAHKDQLSIAEMSLEYIYVQKDKSLHNIISEKISLLYGTYAVSQKLGSQDPISEHLFDDMSTQELDSMVWDFYLYLAQKLTDVLPSLKKIKEQYPILATSMNDVLDELINCKNQRELIGKYERKLRKLLNISSKVHLYSSDYEEPEYYDSYEQGTYKRDNAKIGRNDPCPCGSGKKYKKCCGK